ncbi:phosphoglycerate kinase [Candidatus Magnetomonas plexicatena]|uniref:phosphoglycerate kinase n=1 Tax=Candidatus Magnetomonas plexicatena TaxID=2552947 RepID=UPI001C76C0D6|nr:phosphoglycerate kinase [Nitrospirales bacterium LBB_01]
MALETLVINDLELKGKRTFIRVDFNVPFDDAGAITDDTRIRSAVPTIKKAIEMGARVILASHLGRPKGKPNPKYSLKPVAVRLQEVLGKPVAFAPDCIGPEVEKMVSALKDGDVLLLENVRFYAEEEKNDAEFSKSLAKLADVYVNDAFGTAHRAHATTEGITKHISKSAAGFLMKKELDYLINAIENPTRPFTAIVGGAKVSGKIGVLEHLSNKVNKIIVGGGMANTFFKAQGFEIGDSLCEDDMLDTAKSIMTKMKANNVELLLPIDCVIAQNTEPGTPTKVVSVKDVPAGWRILDIGPESSKIFAEAVKASKTIVWNGPMGLFEIEAFSAGTFELAKAVAASGGTSIIGGGDSVLAVNRAGVADKVSFISTGGGASLELLEGKVLPGVAALTQKK